MTPHETGSAGDQNDPGHPGGPCAQRGTAPRAPLNGEKFRSKDGLMDLVAAKLTEEPLFPPIHLEGKDDWRVVTVRDAQGRRPWVVQPVPRASLRSPGSR